MITDQELINSRPSALMDFETIEEILDQFYPDKTLTSEVIANFKGIKVLISYYSYYNYNGTCFILFTQNNKLYTVESSHCSCHGLEGTWDQLETSAVLLNHLYNNGAYAELPWGLALAKLLKIPTKESVDYLQKIRDLIVYEDIYVGSLDDLKYNSNLKPFIKNITKLFKDISVEVSCIYDLNEKCRNLLLDDSNTQKYLDILDKAFFY